MERERYAIKSNVNGKFLSSLFPDAHLDRFNESTFDVEKCYFYRSREVAEDIAKAENGTVVEVEAV